MRPPFPYYGNKYQAARRIEALHGDVHNLVVPFAGSLGELLGRSKPATVETVNDLDAFVVNVWRALVSAPEQLAKLCDEPVHETTLHSVHSLLLSRAEGLANLVASHPRAFDVELAAWWIWGASCWLGSGWCREPSSKRPRLGGQGNRPHPGVGVARPQTPALSGGGGHPKKGMGINNRDNREALGLRFAELAERLRWVRITSGDWRRVLTHAVTTSHGPTAVACGDWVYPEPAESQGLTAVSLDPPYAHDGRSTRLYRKDDPQISADVRAWAIANGKKPLLRITLCGRGGEHDELLEHGWAKYIWRERDQETIWASPHCCGAVQVPLFQRVGGPS